MLSHTDANEIKVFTHESLVEALATLFRGSAGRLLLQKLRPCDPDARVAQVPSRLTLEAEGGKGFSRLQELRTKVSRLASPLKG